MTKLYWFTLYFQQNMKNEHVNQYCFVTIIYSFNIKQSLLSESVQKKIIIKLENIIQDT